MCNINKIDRYNNNMEQTFQSSYVHTMDVVEWFDTIIMMTESHLYYIDA